MTNPVRIADKGGAGSDSALVKASPADRTCTAHPTLVGQSVRELKDKAGKSLGGDTYRVDEDNKVGEVPYMWTRPGSDAQVQQVSYVTTIGDQVCAVGYYQ